MRDKLKRRLRYLWTGELANSLLVMPLVYYAISRRFRLGWFSLAALLLVCTILAVGAAFWFLKGRALAGSERLYRPATRRFFRATKWVFGVWLGALLAVPLVLLMLRGPVWPGGTADLVVGGAFLILAALEFVNYYVVQLSYDNRADLAYLRRHRRLKCATMVRELDI